jgi:carbamoylphosphate synthase large subunit
MFFVDEPYVSEFFKKTLKDHEIPVVGTSIAGKLGLQRGTSVITEAEAIKMVKGAANPAIYTISENSIAWISRNLSFSDLPSKIDLFKDKLKFRKLIQPMFPDFYFSEVRSEDLATTRINEIPLPFIIKPAVGFFSMGVYKVSSYVEWPGIVDSILRELDEIKGLYPEEVLGTDTFIIEECVNGEEFAVDAYFNASGEAVVLGIFKHTFSSDTDVSDRVYITSKEIIEHNIDEFTRFLDDIGQLAGVKNFPVHVEFRRDSDGTLVPIEVNPMRFGGWCTTADASFMAYGFNPYLCYYSQIKPDWCEILKGKQGKLFSIIVLDNSTGSDAGEIVAFDYEKLLSGFEKPMELRKTDHKKYPLFGFLFTETREENFIELKRILDSDLSEFI